MIIVRTSPALKNGYKKLYVRKGVSDVYTYTPLVMLEVAEAHWSETG